MARSRRAIAIRGHIEQEGICGRGTVSSAVRLDLRPGEWVLWKARPFRFVSLQGSTASIRDSVNAELHEVAVADLRGMPSLPPEDLDQRVDRLRTTSDQSWSLAQQRESIIRELQMPASPDERRFYTRLLEILGAPYTSHDQIGALEGRVLHILVEIGTKKPQDRSPAP
jgi:hypothetical protein